MRQLLLGIDVGTTYCKALVLDVGGEELGEARERTPWTPVATGAEIDPHARRADRATPWPRGRSPPRPPGAVAAVGVAGIAETGVLLDRRGEPVGPAIAWHDARGADEARAIAAELGAPTASPRRPACPPRRCAR